MQDENRIDTVEAYIAQFPADRQELLNQIRQIIRRAAPKAEERIRWAMPTYWQGENLVHFANQKNHIGFYPSPEAMEAFAGRLSAYRTSKGGVQFPVSKPIPYELIGEITEFRVKMVEEKKM